MTPSDAFLVVGIGASAGGLEAFTRFFVQMPADSGMAFVLIQHLSPDHHSFLVDLIGRATEMPVQEAMDGARVAPDHVYVIPPNATLTMTDGRLRVETPAPPRDHRMPINTFFTSLARDQGENAVCIVLSGAGRDGALGLAAIKEHGGLVLAQAGFDHTALSGMPSSAADTGYVDEVLPVEAMPARLAAYRLSRIEEDEGPVESGERTRERVTHIGALLRARCGHDFSQHKQSTMLRRIRRRLRACRVVDLPDYIAYVKEHPEELDALFRDLLIGVTEFFRNPAAFDALREQVIAPLLEQRENEQIRIWVPGCATGEEAYSLAILIVEEMEKRGRPQKVQILATDIDERAIAQARSGRYPLPSPGLSRERAEKWFAPEGDKGVAIKTIRDICVFSLHNVTQDPPFSKLDLISCRNLLIYFESGLQDRAIRTFHYALRPEGALFLGASEGVTRNTELFASLDKKHRLFRRRDDGASRRDVPGPFRQSHPKSPTAVVAGTPFFSDDHFDKSARRALEAFSPGYVIVDQNNDIRRFSGAEAGRFLETSAGLASFNLFTLLRKPLRPVVRAALLTMAETRTAVVRERVALKIDGANKSVKVVVAPLADNQAQQGYYVVAFQEMSAAAPLPESPSSEQMLQANVQMLEDELFTVKAQLQAAVSEFEIVNEEIRSANEEYQSTNEELQSSNEELETTKEEMQSVNEELQTINGEMIAKNELLVLVNSDLKNVLESTEIATLFLDNDLRVKSFTPGMTSLFHLRDADIHRPINEIATLLNYPDLASDAARVIRHLGVVERQVESGKTDAAYIMRIRPYRRVDNLLDGVVVTFVEFTALKRAEDALRESRRRSQMATEATEVGVFEWDAAADSFRWDAQMFRIYGIAPTTDGIVPLDVWADQVAPEERACQKEQMQNHLDEGSVRHREFQIRRRDNGELRVIHSVERVELAAEGQAEVVVGTNLDVTERRRAEQALRESESALQLSQSSLRLAANAARLTFADLDFINDSVTRGKNFASVMGYQPENPATGGAIDAALAGLLDHAFSEDRSSILQAYRQMRAGLDMERIEYRLIGDDGVERWMESIGKTEIGDDGRPVRAFVTHLDITSQVESRIALAAAKNKVDEILASIADGFYVLDAEWRFTYFSASAEKLLGKQRDEVIGQLFVDVFPMCKDSLVHSSYRQVMTGKEPLEFEYISDILKRWTAYSVYPTGEGGVSVYIRDISSHKAVEDQLIAAKAEAESANQAKSKFLAAASHDLRQPVQSLVLLLSVIERQVAAYPKPAEIVNLMHTAVDGLLGLLTGVLDISRLDAGVVAPVAECVDIGALVSRLAAEYAPKAANKALGLRSVPQKLVARTDAALLERALRNLIENALRYTPEGAILLGVRRRGAFVRVDVIDTGMGIPAAKQTEIFAEFHQLNNPGRNLEQGLGLGLAIVGRLASLLGSKIEVASNVGRGSRFSLYLPAVHDAAPIPASQALPIDDPGGRVLIVEDNAIVRSGLDALLRMCGYETFTAAFGEDALEIAAKEAWRFDIIVADYRLGAGLTGIETAKEIRHRAGRPVPTIVLTGDTAEEHIADIATSGFTVLHKPADVEDLRREMARLLN